MRIGVPKEVKDQEYRVGLTPDGVRILVERGHAVAIESAAGEGSGFGDETYLAAGAQVAGRESLFGDSDLVVKVKDPTPDEVALLSRNQVLYTYLHLAAAPELTAKLLDREVRTIAYETIQNEDGSFPVLAPMSEVAGRLATQIGVTLLQKNRGGKGLLVGGVPGVMRGRVTVVGGGIVGINALRVAHALGAEVDVLDIDLRRLAYIYDIFHGELNTLFSNPTNIERSVLESDLVIGAVYTHGRRAPTLVTEEMVKKMETGSVVVDVAVDQGGCVETIRPTTHSDPVYKLHDVIHYGVSNMPGAVPRTSTFALTNATFPFIEAIAQFGVEAAIQSDPALAKGVNTWDGHLVCEGVGESLSLPWEPIERFFH